MPVVPVVLEVVVVRKLGKVPHVRLDAVHVQIGGQASDGDVRVGVDAPALVIALLKRRRRYI